MQKGKSKFIPLLFSLVDIILLLSAFFLAKYLILDKLSMNTLFYSNFNTLFNNSLILGWSLLWIGISLKFDLYEMPRILFVHKIVAENVYALFTFMFLSCGLIFLITDYSFRGHFLL